MGKGEGKEVEGRKGRYIGKGREGKGIYWEEERRKGRYIEKGRWKGMGGNKKKGGRLREKWIIHRKEE